MISRSTYFSGVSLNMTRDIVVKVVDCIVFVFVLYLHLCI